MLNKKNCLPQSPPETNIRAPKVWRIYWRNEQKNFFLWGDFRALPRPEVDRNEQNAATRREISAEGGVSCNFMPAIWSGNFMSCNFMACNMVLQFQVLHFHVRHFQRVPHSSSGVFSLCRLWTETPKFGRVISDRSEPNLFFSETGILGIFNDTKIVSITSVSDRQTDSA